MLPAARRVATSAHHAYETYETRDARNGEAYPGAPGDDRLDISAGKNKIVQACRV